jgi:hypothetical protein
MSFMPQWEYAEVGVRGGFNVYLWVGPDGEVWSTGGTGFENLVTRPTQFLSMVAAEGWEVLAPQQGGYLLRRPVGSAATVPPRMVRDGQLA